jgi:hypothetical protein
MKTRLKDWPKVYRKLEGMRGLSVEERVLLAQGLAATPEERWQQHDQFLRSFGLYSHWERKKLGFKL